MSLTNSPFWMAQTSGDFYDHTIDNSLRFEGISASSYLSRTFTAGSNTTWTFSWWFKPDLVTNNNGTLPYFFTTSGNTFIRQQSGEGYQIEGNLRGSGGTNYFFSYAPFLRDSSAWYHCVIAVDTSQGTSSNRVKFYLNGEQQTTAGSLGLNYPPLNHNTQVNTAVAHRIGAHPSAPSSYAFSGYMAEINFVDGTQLDASSFGETKSGIWIPKIYSGSYGTNGFYLKFANSAAFGTDSSGNGNTWTANNFSTYDQMPDSPTNNFSTNNGIMRANITQSQGNLKMVGVGVNFDNMGNTFTFDVEDADGWYWEYRSINNNSDTIVGISTLQNVEFNQSDATNPFANTTACVGYMGSGQKKIAGTNSSYGNSWTAGDVIGIAVKAGAVYFYKNGVIQNSGTAAATGLTGNYVAAYAINGTYSGTANYGQDSTFVGTTTAGGNSDANGYGDFKYSVPSGYKTLCSANMPEPTFSPADDDIPEDYFNTVLYSGNSTNNTPITGVGFQPDFTWIKTRNVVRDHRNMDAVRGATAGIYSNLVNVEGASPLLSFDSDGFTLNNTDNYNNTGETYVSWNWLAGNSTSSNTSGSITSTVSVNTNAGFSILTYTGNGSTNQTIGHGLGTTPDMFIIKRRTGGTASWLVWHNQYGSPTTNYQLLDGDSGLLSYGTMWGTHTSSVINLSPTAVINEQNASGSAYVCYAFAEKEGYSKIGKYTGNGSSDGPFIYTGFRPAFLLMKRTDSSGDWMLEDNKRLGYNVDNNDLVPNQSYSEATDDRLDILSNGFKLRSSFTTTNASGGTYIYLAIAEQPFKYANAR